MLKKVFKIVLGAAVVVALFAASFLLYFRKELRALFSFAGNPHALAQEYSKAQTPEDRFYLASQVLVADLGEKLSTINSKAPPADPLVEEAKKYVEWTSSLLKFYVDKVPAGELQLLLDAKTPKLRAEGVGPNWENSDLISAATASMTKVKACTPEEFSALVNHFGRERISESGVNASMAYIQFDRILGADFHVALLGGAIRQVENPQHTPILKSYLRSWQFARMASHFLPAYPPKITPLDFENALQFSRQAPNCFGSKPFSSFAKLVRELRTPPAQQ